MTFFFVKMSNPHPLPDPPSLGVNIDRCITLIGLCLPRPQSLSKGGEENEKKLFVGRAKKNSLLGARRSHHALPGNDITATDLYRLQLHCTVPNEGPAEEAGFVHQRLQTMFEKYSYILKSIKLLQFH